MVTSLSGGINMTAENNRKQKYICETPTSYGVSMDNVHAAQYERLYGFVSTDEQAAIMGQSSRVGKVCVRLAGAGGGGSLVAEGLTMMGIQDISVADPGLYTKDSANRNLAATFDAFGENKARVSGERAAQHSDSSTVRVYEDGVTKENLDEFLLGGESYLQQDKLTIVINEIDILRPDLALMLSKRARELNMPMILGTDMGFGGIVTVFDPKSRYTYEKVNGISEVVAKKLLNGIDTGRSEDVDLSLSSLGYLPKYGDLNTLLTLQNNKDVGMPTTPESVLVTTALVMNEVRRLVNGQENNRQKPTYAPRVRWHDVEGGSGSTRFPRLSYWQHLVNVIVRDRVLRVNPKTSYAIEDINARSEYRRAHGEPE
jgi:molybdopterin/thiamine biosynthesis adenylyltransferase